MITKGLLFSALIFTIISCGNNSTASTGQNKENENSGDISNIEMFKATDCATCHKKNETLVGPSFSDIAWRYANAADTTVTRLAITIINGSSGRWTAVAPMTPHPSLSKAEAESMVKYILQYKK